jgi:hypothetical protein
LCIDLKKKKILGKRGLTQNFPKGQKRRIFLNKSSSEYGERFPHGTILDGIYYRDCEKCDEVWCQKFDDTVNPKVKTKSYYLWV